ncbi:uncharacterized protein LOC111494189 [Cucurbita maxima]|uniref:Uncharacterized protein LOC111494189 n=1 Tax=Cucurbita maxima TaxID=3661 RepID=A0A6J1KE78_CUCMA|nr:uncharacterized protein LOC111494189 [Cucurbita maxima]
MLARESWVEKNYPSNLVPNENVSNYQNCILTSIKDSDLNLKGCMSFEDARNNDSARVSPSERRLPSDTNSNASRRGHIAVTQNLNARICLDSFHTTLISAHQLSAVSINLLEVSRCLLLAHENTDTELLERKMLKLLPPEHNDDLGDIDFTNCVSIHLRDFRRIVHQELSVSYQDRVCITTSESQIKLSVGDKKTILTRERGEYVNINPQGVETRFEFSIHPTSFFNNLTDKSRRVWFLKTTNSLSIICVPFACCGCYLMYFPPCS